MIKNWRCRRRLGTRLCLPPGCHPQHVAANVHVANKTKFITAGFTVYPWCAVAHHDSLLFIFGTNGTSVAQQNSQYQYQVLLCWYWQIPIPIQIPTSILQSPFINDDFNMIIFCQRELVHGLKTGSSLVHVQGLGL